MPEDVGILKSGVGRSIENWEKVLKATQEQFPQAAQRPWSPSQFSRDGWAPNIQSWLTRAKAAVQSGDRAALTEAREMARHAWRPASTVMRTAVQATPTSVQLPLSFGSTPAQPMPFVQTFANGVRSTIQVARTNLPAAARQTVEVVRRNPATVPLAVAAGEAAAVGGARGVFGGWVGVAVGATVAVAIAVGVWAWTNSGSSDAEPVSAGDAPAQTLEPRAVPPPVENLLGPGGGVDPSNGVPPAPNAAPIPVPAPTPTPEPPSPSQPTPPPAPPPTPQCQYPGSIGVSGGSVSSLGPQGGSFTATGPVTLSTGGLVNCGQHYQLAYSTGDGASGYDCKTSGFNYSLGSGQVQAGDSVSVNFNLPPNSCG
jgi:hypothetical protein